MRTRKQTIAIARSQQGVRENPPGSNRTKYGRWYGMNGVPWCAICLSWVFAQAGFTGRKKALYRAHYTPDWAQEFKAAKRWRTSPRRGYVAFFDFPDSVRRIQHVGLVLRVNDNGTITTFEGNTSSSAAGSQDNGDGAFVRVRLQSHVVGYGAPKYLLPERLASLAEDLRKRLRKVTRRLNLALREPS